MSAKFRSQVAANWPVTAVGGPPNSNCGLGLVGLTKVWPTLLLRQRLPMAGWIHELRPNLSDLLVLPVLPDLHDITVRLGAAEIVDSASLIFGIDETISKASADHHFL
jgi:hypothetical protein